MSTAENEVAQKMSRKYSVDPFLYKSQESPQSQEKIQEVANLKKYILKLEKENEKLKEALIAEQNDKIAKTKDSIELEERLKIAEKQITESTQSRIKLTNEIAVFLYI